MADIAETEYYFARAEAVSYYGIENGGDIFDIVSKFCRTSEMFELGEKLAELYILNQITGWETILARIKELLDELNEEERYGCFSSEVIGRWESMVF